MFKALQARRYLLLSEIHCSFWGGVILMFSTSIKLASFSLLIIPIIIFPLLYFGRFLRKLTRQTQDKLADSAGLASEYIFAATTIQTNSYQEHAVNEYNDIIEDSYFKSKTRVLARAIMIFLIIILVFLAISFVVWAGLKDVASGSFSIGELLQFCLYSLVVGVNVGIGENIAEALEEKLARDKSLNREFQTQSQSSILEKFSFDIPSQIESSTPITSPPLLVDAPNITDQEIQLVSETTEATNNILDETVAKMLKELGEETHGENTAQLVTGTNSLTPLEQRERETSETVIFNNALSTVQRLQEIQDIRAIFEILGIGS